MPELRPEGFYRVCVSGQRGVAYCHHEVPSDIEFDAYEVWTTLHLFDRFDGKLHPATSTIIPNLGGHALNSLEVLGRIRA